MTTSLRRHSACPRMCPGFPGNIYLGRRWGDWAGILPRCLRASPPGLCLWLGDVSYQDEVANGDAAMLPFSLYLFLEQIWEQTRSSNSCPSGA